MPVTPTLFSGTNGTLPVGTETFIDVNEAGVFTYHVDVDLMQDGDILRCLVYQKVLTGGTAIIIGQEWFYGADGGVAGLKGFHSDAYVNDLAESQGLRFSFLQSAGTGRALPRKVEKV